MTAPSEISIREWWIEDPEIEPESSQSFLCHVCRHVNFKFLLFNTPLWQIPDKNEVPLGSYSRILESQICAFCRLIKATLDNTFGPSVLPTQHGGHPVMISMVPTSETFEKSHARQLLLWVKPNPLENGKTPPLEIHNVPVGHWIDGTGAGKLIQRKNIDFLLALYWIRTCRMSYGLHKDYDVERDDYNLPPDFRLIDTKRKCIVRAETSPEYVTLSYVWPRKEQLRLLKNNTEQLIDQDGALAKPKFDVQIPQTIKDAIELCVRIGERYLWVDALCIIQDNQQDKDAQIPAMDCIYGSSALTIASTCGEGAEASMSGVRAGSREFTQAVESIQGFRLANRPWSFEKSVQGSKWNTRAWTFQERILSKRTLFVTPQQTFFKCRHSPGRLSEDLDTKLKTRRRITYPMDDTGTETIPHRWSINILTYLKTVEQFSARDITRREDILNAFKGIEQKMKPLFRSDFLYGLPQSELDYCLLWEPGGRLQRRLCDKPPGGKVPSDKVPKFPSWSWAGWEGPVRYNWEERLSRLKWVDESNKGFTSDDYRAPYSERAEMNIQEWRKEWTEERTSSGFRFFHHPSNPDVWFRNPTAPGPRRGPNCQPECEQLQFEAEVIHVTMPREWSAQQTASGKRTIWEFGLTDREGYAIGCFRVPIELAIEMDHHKKYSFVRIARTKHGLSHEEIKARKERPNDPEPHFTSGNTEGEEHPADDDIDVTTEPAFFPGELRAQDAKYSLPFDRQRYDAYKPFCLYEFLVVVWVHGVAYRIGIGKIHVDAWAQDSPTREVVVLG